MVNTVRNGLPDLCLDTGYARQTLAHILHELGVRAVALPGDDLDLAGVDSGRVFV